MIMRATQKKMMSGPVTRSVVGQNFFNISVCSGQPIVANGHNHELNQVSRTSGSWVKPSLSNTFASSVESVAAVTKTKSSDLWIFHFKVVTAPRTPESSAFI